MANMIQTFQDQDMHERGLEDPVSENELRDIAPKIANGRRNVAAKLGLEDHEIDNIEADCFGPGRGGIEEAALKMLLKWKRSNGDQATLEILCTALRAAGFRNVAEYLEANIR